MIAPEEVVKERLKVCDNCEHKRFGVCTQCSCIIIAKTKVAAAECPLKKWEKFNQNSNEN